MKLKTSGKINLNLSIGNIRNSNLHEVESLIVPIDLFDEIDIKINDKEYDEIIFTDNPNLSINSTVHKALLCLRSNSNLDRFFDIRVNKYIPIEAGLGGGSSDAAAVITGISNRLGISLPDFTTIAKDVGSDVPFFINGKTSQIKGIGDEINNFEIAQDLFFLVIVPIFGISTKAVFQEWDKLNNEDTKSKKFYFNDDITIFNDSLEIALRLEPKMKIYKETLEEVLEKEVFITGTGSTLFSIYNSKEEAEYAKGNIDIDNRLLLVTKKIDYSYKELSD